MKVKQQFIAMIGLIGILMILVCAVGYNMSRTMLTESIHQQLMAIVETRVDRLDTWIAGKSAVVDSMSTTLSKQPYEIYGKVASVPFLAGIEGDSDVLDVAIGAEDGTAYGYFDGDLVPEGYDPRVRDWYIDAKATRQRSFTEAYATVGGSTDGMLVISYVHLSWTRPARSGAHSAKISRWTF